MIDVIWKVLQPGLVILLMPCADPESFARGGPTLTTFLFSLLVYEGRKDANTTVIGSLWARQRNAIYMAFRWSAHDDPTLNAGLVALRIFRGSEPVLQRNPIFCDFSGGEVWTPCPPLDSPMDVFIHKNFARG